MNNALLTWPQLQSFACLGAANTAGHAIADNDDKCAIVKPAPRSGTITHIGFSTRTVTTPATIEVRVETLSGINPSGTLYHANATGSQASPASNTFYRVPMNGGAGFPVTVGEMLAVVMSCPSGSPNLEILRNVGLGSVQEPVVRTYSTSWSTAMTGTPALVFEYSDAPTIPYMGMHAFPAYPTVRSFNVNTTGTTTGDEAGVEVTLPFGGRAIGIRLSASISQAFELKLYSGTTELATSRTFAASEIAAADYRTQSIPFTSPVNLQPGTYIIALRPTTTSNVTLPEIPIQQSGYQAVYGYPAGSGVRTRVDLGFWEPVDTTRLFPLALDFDSIEEAGSSTASRRRQLIWGS